MLVTRQFWIPLTSILWPKNTILGMTMGPETVWLPTFCFHCVCVCVLLIYEMKYFFQGVFETQGGRESHSSWWTEEQWEWILVSCAAEDCALWPGLPPQRPDQWWEETGRRGLFLRGALPPHLHLYSRCWHQPSCTQVRVGLCIWKPQICIEHAPSAEPSGKSACCMTGFNTEAAKTRVKQMIISLN